MAQIIRAAQIEQTPVLISYRRAGPEAPVEPAPEPPPAPPPAYPSMAALAASVAEPLPAPPPQPEVDFDALRREASEQGYREGYETGVRAAKAGLAEELERLQALGRSIEEALARGLEGLEDIMVEIAFAAACKVLGEAALAEEGVRNMVREAMREVRSKEGLVLRLSPRDYELVHSQAARERPLVDDAKVEIVADDRVAAGCIVETRGGTLDARLEVQLRKLLDTLARARSAPGDA